MVQRFFGRWFACFVDNNEANRGKYSSWTSNTLEVMKPKSYEIIEVKRLSNLKVVFLENQSVDFSVWPLKLMILNISRYW
jgi:hypothetical protein